MTSGTKHWTALAMLAACTFSTGGSFVLFKASVILHQPFALGESSWFVTAHDLIPRFFIGVLVLLAWYGRKVLQLTRPEWQQAGFMAVTSFAGCMLQLDGLQRTSAATTAFLTQFFVVLIPLWWALLHRRRPAWPVLVACGLVLTGMAVLARVDWHDFRLGRGEAEVLLGAVFFSLLLISLNWPAFATNRAERTSAAMFLLEGGLFLAVSVAVCREPAHLLAPYASFGWVGVMLAATVFGTIGPFAVMNHWQRYVTPTEAGMLYCFCPVVAAVAEVFFPEVLSRWTGVVYANQPLTLTLAVGGAFILGANLLVQWSPGTRPPAQ
ncbi:MAG: EamA family transporter [Opitutaceae bacterium]|nr:EamA family transporter [Opitutaceae bacterium]MBP9912912.1 EamA family transporter [Opitutaceae bacterium]